MKFIREHKKVSIFVAVFLALFVVLSVTYAKYIYNIIDEYILETKAFYFNSSVMSVNNKTYNVNNWDGVSSYFLTVDVNSKKNEVKSTTADIDYSVEVICPENIRCELSKSHGVIYEENKTDSFQLTVVPLTNFYEGDEVKVQLKATSNSPYKKTLEATYIIGVLKSNFSYSITDSPNSLYATLNVTNAVSYYEVEEAFLNYQVGDQISLEDYINLSDSDKDKCYSAKVTISFDSRVLALDMTANSYLHPIENTVNTNTLDDNYKYVVSYSFKLDTTSTEKIIFYKKDKSLDYTYPIVNNDSIVTVSAILAD